MNTCFIFYTRVILYFFIIREVLLLQWSVLQWATVPSSKRDCLVGKHARVSFSKTIKIARVDSKDECNLKSLKNSRVYVFLKLHEKPYY